MQSTAASDQRSYRRGLIVGLTLAEVFLLVLFGLLLAWIVGTEDSNALRTQIADLQTKVADLHREVENLQAQRSALLGSTAPDKFDELFRELTLARQKLSEHQQHLAELEERAQLLEEAARETGVSQDSRRDLTSAIRARLEIANAVLAAAGKSGLADRDVATFEKTVAGLLQMRQRLLAEGLKEGDVQTLAGRLRNAERRLQEATKGTEWPACWADSAGKPEYIFDVTLTTGSLVVHDNALPHRRSEQAALPTARLLFGSDLSTAAFREQTQPLFEWSKRANCRFFVRLHDLTEAHEKDVYKLRVRTVGEHFYYYEPVNTSS